MATIKSRPDLFKAVQVSLKDAIEEFGTVVEEVVLTRWHTGYLAKSDGGQDEFGNEWDELAESTIRQKQQRLRGGFRDVDRREQWEQRHQRLTNQLTAAGMSLRDAQQRATELAWGTGREIPINVDTTALERSLSPEGAFGQVREQYGDTISIGTFIEYAKHVDARRRIKPTKEELRVWVRAATDVLRARVVERIVAKV